MIEDVSFVGHEGLVPEGGLHCRDAFLVLFKGEVGEPLSVEDLRVSAVDFECSPQVIDCFLVLAHVRVALSTVFEEFNVFGLSHGGFVKRSDCLVVVFFLVVAASQSVLNLGTGMDGSAFLKFFDRSVCHVCLEL